jgi:hypothetical protein
MNNICRGLWVLFLSLICCAQSGCGAVAEPMPAPSVATDVEPSLTPAMPVTPRDASDELFARAEVLHLAIEIADEQLAKLRENPREFVRCRLIERDGDSYDDVALKLKGAAGSFREFDDKPALTLRMTKFKKKQDFHALDKFHLNNSVQDDTYLNELLCSELFLASGVAAPRVTHARLTLNDRDVGLYVLKEGFEPKFLARHFADATGNLYDGGFCQEIDAELERDSGKGVDDFSDLRSLVEACRVEDLDERRRRMAERLDVNAFLTFAALERMTGHWDGYCLNRNNYRVYFEPRTGKAYFLPHGMDQMFGDPNASVLEWPGALVALAVIENPEWREQYRAELRKRLPLFSPADALTKRVDEIAPRLRKALEETDPEAGPGFDERIADLKNRLTERARSLVEQMEYPDPGPPAPPMPLAFEEEQGIELPDWEPHSESEDAALEVVTLDDERTVYSIRSGDSGPCIASWRKAVLLAPGTYRFTMQARTRDVTAHADEKGRGAGLRISGANRDTGLEGTTDWSELEYRFVVDEGPRDIVLVAELRATAGQVEFDAGSARIFQTPGE